MPKSSEEKLAVIRERAFSKVIWGEKDLDVIRFLRTQRVSDDLAISILEEAHQIRASAIRKRSIVKALIGGPIALVSGFIAAFMSFYSEFTVSSLGICFYTICILTCFWCIIFTVKALIELTRGRKRGSALMD